MKCTIVSNKNGKYAMQDITSVQNIEDLMEQKVFWIHIHPEDLENIIDFLNPFKLNHLITEKLKSGEEFSRIKMFGDQMMFSLQLCLRMGSLKKVNITCVFLNDMLISIDNQKVLTPHEIIDELEMLEDIAGITMSRKVILVILNHIVEFNYQLTRELSKKIDTYAKQLMGKSISVKITEIERLKSELSLLDESLDQQYASVALLPIQLPESITETVLHEKLSILEKSIEHLIKVIERSDDKLDNIYSRYLYDLQNKTNKRINTLTIVQAIFVPLTFLAGIYGMNFINMPELKHPNGYFFALGSMFLTAGILIIIFIKNGWFR